MGTLTAINSRSETLPKITVTIEVVPAILEDLRELKYYDETGKPHYGLRAGLVFWLKSSVTNEFESTPRKLTADDNRKELKSWLDHKMIYIAKSAFD